MARKTYLKKGDVIGSSGYTDLIITDKGLKLHSTEGAELDFYDDKTDTHHEVLIDISKKNFGRYYYYK